jgi:sugar/nucleoside kinase (ribokinase family)
MPGDKIDKVMDSTGAGDAFGLIFVRLYQKKLLMFGYRFKISSFKTAKCWTITRQH